MSRTDTVGLRARLRALEAENTRLRTALAAAEARKATSGHGFLLGDALCLREPPLRCAQPSVPGRVSVLVPAFNASRFLERAVRSVWEQSLEAARVEVLLVDDGSTDDTRTIAEELVRRSPVRMQVLAHAGGLNRGVAPSRHLAAEHASGEFVALLDADDVYLPARLRRSVEFLERTGEAVAACSLGLNVDAEGHPVIGHNGTARAGDWRRLGAGLSPPFTFDQLWRAYPVANSTLTIRRSALERVGGFPALMAHQAEDWLLAMKLSLLAPIPCLDDTLILYTHHPGAYTSRYHADGWHDGARLEVLYHLVWWMLQQPEFLAAGSRFFRREYPKHVAALQRLMPLALELHARGASPEDAESTRRHLGRLTAEFESLQRVLRAKLHENKHLRQLVSRLTTSGGGHA